jgi:hypothetical protein
VARVLVDMLSKSRLGLCCWHDDAELNPAFGLFKKQRTRCCIKDALCTCCYTVVLVHISSSQGCHVLS